MLRLTEGEGLCANCAITDFLKRMPPLGEMIERQGPEVLLEEWVQVQVGNVMKSGSSDADLSEIDWAVVVANWGLPVKGGPLA